MPKKIKIIVLVILLLLGFCAASDFFIKSLIGSVASRVTGAPTHVGGFSLSVIKQSMKISDFRMYNPEGFPKDILVDIPKMDVACDLGALATGKVHLKRIDLELKEVGLVRNKDGKLNVDSLKMIEEKKAAAPEKRAENPKKEMAVQIDVAHLAIGRIVSKDYSVEGPPVIKVYDVNLKKSYEDITSIQQLAVLMISEPLKAAGIRGLKVYGASMLTGMAALPVAAVFTLAGKDHAQASFNVTADKAYDAGLQALQQMGSVGKKSRADGMISAVVSGVNVTLKVRELDDTATEITVSARKLGIPKPDVASGVIYQITNQLK